MSARHAFITGGGSGIGLATARTLAASGDKLTLAGRKLDKVRAAAEEFEHAHAVACDVTDEASVTSAFAAARDRYGVVDILVNNAGQAPSAPFKHTTLAFWNEVLATNLTGAFLCTRVALPDMIDAKWGRIVNVCSSAAKRPSGMTPEYSVTKAAELSLSRVFADAYAAHGVLVNAVCPGPTKSELWMDPGGLLDQSAELAGNSRDEALASVGAGRPIGRLAEVSEIADAIVFLCSERASYVAGAAWSVDGGTVQVII